MYVFYALAALALSVSAVIDLELQRWDFSNRVRWVIIVLCGWLSTHFARQTTARWLHLIVALVAAMYAILVVYSYFRQRRRGRRFTIAQGLIKLVIFIVPTYYFIILL